MRETTLRVNDDVGLCPTDENGLIDCTECYIHHDGYCTIDPLLVKYYDTCFSESIKRRKEVI
jgi:hypothetical protein